MHSFVCFLICWGVLGSWVWSNSVVSRETWICFPRSCNWLEWKRSLHKRDDKQTRSFTSSDFYLYIFRFDVNLQYDLCQKNSWWMEHFRGHSEKSYILCIVVRHSGWLDPNNSVWKQSICRESLWVRRTIMGYCFCNWTVQLCCEHLDETLTRWMLS